MTTTGLKTAAIWARVSTKGQAEISLPGQIDHCQKLLKSKGYIATKIFSVDYCSLDLYNCPEFQQLKRIISDKQVQAVCIYNRDRVEAQGYQRLNFLEDLKHAGVELLICDGPPAMNEPEGYALEVMYAAGKERSVLRARTGSRDGLRARVTLKNKPANHRVVYGYDWDWDANHEKLIPNADYPNVELIFSLALSGNGYDKITTALAKKGISSLRGSKWNDGVLSALLHNSVYAGRFAALKTTTIRNSNKPGFKVKRLPESDWTFIPNVIIEQHPITWEQRTQLFEAIQKRVNLSKRHANYDYLLRGMIDCDEHISSKGKHIRYHGQPINKGYGYACTGTDGHRHHTIQGAKIEQAVKAAITNIFESENPSFWQKINNLEKVNRPQLELELKKQQAKLDKANQDEATLEVHNIQSGMKPPVYELARGKLHVARMSIEQGLKDTQEQLLNAYQSEEKMQSFNEIREKFLINAGKFTDSQWRELLETLDCQIRIFQPDEYLSKDYNLVLPEYIEVPGESPIKVSDDAKRVIRNLLVTDDFTDGEMFDPPMQLSPSEAFLVRSNSDASLVLEKFNAVMLLKGPYRVPQQIRDIGLAIPQHSKHSLLPVD